MTRGRKGMEKLDGGESGVRRGPWPDHTDTLGSVSPCQLCSAVNSQRTHSHIHILIYACWRWGHTWPVCMCVYLSVYLIVTTYPCVLKCVNATKNPAVCVCFPPGLCAFVFTSLNLCAHLCVHVYLLVCWSVLVLISICFSSSAARAGRILVCSVSPCSTPSSQPLLHMCVTSANH